MSAAAALSTTQDEAGLSSLSMKEFQINDEDQALSNKRRNAMADIREALNRGPEGSEDFYSY